MGAQQGIDVDAVVGKIKEAEAAPPTLGVDKEEKPEEPRKLEHCPHCGYDANPGGGINVQESPMPAEKSYKILNVSDESE